MYPRVLTSSAGVETLPIGPRDTNLLVHNGLLPRSDIWYTPLLTMDEKTERIESAASMTAPFAAHND